MRRVNISFILMCFAVLQLSQQQTIPKLTAIDPSIIGSIQIPPLQIFKPTTQTTGPYGRASGTSFNIGVGAVDSGPLPFRVTISHQSQGLNSISFTYGSMIGETTKTGGKKAGAITEVDLNLQLGNIVRAEVCTGKRSGSTVIIGLKFHYENGMSNYFHGDTTQVSSFKCVDATPKTPGYYLQSLGGRYGTYINQLTFHWVSNFEQEQACYDDPNCHQKLDYCPGGDCCFHKELFNGIWETSEDCA